MKRDRRERLLLQPAARVRVPQRDEPIGIGVRQRPQQHGIDDREDGRARADAEREHEDGDGGESGTQPKLTHGEANRAARDSDSDRSAGEATNGDGDGAGRRAPAARGSTSKR